jgi:hypothetical protein
VRLQLTVVVCAAYVLLAVSPIALAQTAAVSIVAPQNEETVHDNSGNVAVQVAVSGGKRAGDQLVLLLDGNPVPGRGDSRFMLTGVDRGTHTLQAQLIDSSGSPRASSPVVTFYMWQASRLSPLRKGQK